MNSGTQHFWTTDDGRVVAVRPRGPMAKISEVIWCELGRAIVGEIMGHFEIIRTEKPLHPRNNGKDNILIFRQGGMGDLILLSNAVMAYKDEHPEKNVYFTMLDCYVPVFRGMPGVKGILRFDEITEAAFKSGFENVIGLVAAVEPEIQMPQGRLDWEDYVNNDRVALFERKLGVHPKKKKFFVNVNRELEARTRTRLGQFDPSRPKVAIAVGSISWLRFIPRDLLMKIIHAVIEKMNASVVLIGTTQDWCQWVLNISGDRILNLVDRTSVEEMIAAVSVSDMLISSDTGPAHIGGVLGKPTVVLTGSIPFDLRYAYYPSARMVEAKGKEKYKCYPCHDINERMIGADKCIHRDNAGPPCLSEISVDDVIEACHSFGKDFGIAFQGSVDEELRTILCSTMYLKDQASVERYRKFVNHYGKAFPIVFIDDGSDPGLLSMLHVPVFVVDDLPDVLPAVSILTLSPHLGRPSHLDFKGWWRSFQMEPSIAKTYGFNKIVHLDSDSYILTNRLWDYVKGLKRGWTTLWCPRHRFAEASVQIICKDQFQSVEMVVPSTNTDPENVLPFTHIERGFVGDRYGEYAGSIPQDADFACQAERLNIPK